MKKRRYPLLSERFERDALTTLEIAQQIGREFVMMPDGDIVPRQHKTIGPRGVGNTGTAEGVDEPTQ